MRGDRDKDSVKEQFRKKMELKIVDECVAREMPGVREKVKGRVMGERRGKEFRLSRGRSVSEMNRIKREIEAPNPIHQSPLLSARELSELNRIRNTSSSVTTKIYESTKVDYKSNLDDDLMNKLDLLATLHNQNWIKKPQLSQVMNLNLLQKAEITKDFPTFNLPEVITHDPKKYSRDDISALFKWYKHSFQATNTGLGAGTKNQDYMSRMYYLHLAAIKEYTRIISLQSSQKGLFLQQFMAGFFSLINDITNAQHRQHQQDFKRNKSQMQDLRHVLDQNHSILLEKINKQQEIYREFQLKYNKLAVVYFSYQTINREVMSQNSILQTGLKELSETYQLLKLEHFKLLNRLSEQGKIQKENNKFYMLSKSNKPQLITHFTGGKQQYQKYIGQIKNIHSINSQLAKYWAKIQDTFSIQKMLPSESLFPGRVETWVQTDGYQLYMFDKGVQNYSLRSEVSDISLNEDERIEGFLHKEIFDQGEQGKEKESNDLVMTLKELYEEVYSQNLRVKEESDRLVGEMKEMRVRDEGMTKALAEEKKLCERRGEQLKQLREENDNLYLDVADKETRLAQALEEGERHLKNYNGERLNNQFFVKNEYQLKKTLDSLRKETSEKIKDLELQVKKMKGKITKGCVVINNYLDIVEGNIDRRYQEIGRKLEEIFKEELEREERDANVFITKA